MSNESLIDIGDAPAQGAEPAPETVTGEAVQTSPPTATETAGRPQSSTESGAMPSTEANAAPSTIKIGDADFEVPGDVATHVAALQKQIDDGAPQTPTDGYQLNVPEAFADRVQADPNDPRVEKLFEIAKTNGWKQDTVDALVAMEYANVAAAVEADTQAQANEKESLIKMMDPDGAMGGEAALAKATEYGTWAVGLLGDDLKANPALMDELRFMTTTANGVALLKAIKDRTSVAAAPRASDANAQPNPFATDTFNLTDQGRIMRENPDLAASLKAQIGTA